jgi:hypothetical protein
MVSLVWHPGQVVRLPARSPFTRKRRWHEGHANRMVMVGQLIRPGSTAARRCAAQPGWIHSIAPFLDPCAVPSPARSCPPRFACRLPFGVVTAVIPRFVGAANLRMGDELLRWGGLITFPASLPREGAVGRVAFAALEPSQGSADRGHAPPRSAGGCRACCTALADTPAEGGTPMSPWSPGAAGCRAHALSPTTDRRLSASRGGTSRRAGEVRRPGAPLVQVGGNVVAFAARRGIMRFSRCTTAFPAPKHGRDPRRSRHE